MGFQKLVDLVFPPLCVVCGEELLGLERLCAGCWPSVHFVGSSGCCKCGQTLDGDVEQGTLCDSCLRIDRPWALGTAAISYRDAGRDLVLQFKHRDRLDLLGPLADWMVSALHRLELRNPLLIPIPLHRGRLWKRRYNQAALLTQEMANSGQVPWDGRSLLRTKSTLSLGHSSADQRADILKDAMRFTAGPKSDFKGKDIVLVDDVMASGSTFSEATRAMSGAGAASINVLALARATNSA